MKVVITGAAGFIGSHLADSYLVHGHDVVAVDNLVTGSRANLNAARESRSLTLLETDVAREDWRKSQTVNGAELILHFASPASPLDYERFPLQTMAVNSRGTEQCCELALKQGARLLYASTSEAYGDPLEHPQKESYWGNVNPVGPRSCYDESKRFGEALVMSYVRAHGLDARIIRVFNTYGPRMRLNDGRAVPTFIRQALAGEPLTLYGDGEQTRSFCYIEDLVEGIVRCADAPTTCGLVTNLGNPQECTIQELAQAICELVGVPPAFVWRPLPENDPIRRRPDITRARKLLGWEPRVALKSGLRNTIDYLRSAAKALPAEV